MKKGLKWLRYFSATTCLLTSSAVFADDFVSDQTPISCLLQPSMEVALSSEVPGVVKSISVQHGDKINRGDVVLTLKSDLETAALNTVAARLEFASRKVERNADLVRKNLISDIEQDEMLTEQRLAALQLREARVRLDQRETKSPISGVVIEKLKQPGEFVDETPFLRLATLDPIHAEVVLPSELYRTVKKGEDVKLAVDGNESIYQGKVKTIDPIIDAASNTFAVTLTLPNPSNELAAGLRCAVDFLSIK